MTYIFFRVAIFFLLGEERKALIKNLIKLLSHKRERKMKRSEKNVFWWWDHYCANFHHLQNSEAKWKLFKMLQNFIFFFSFFDLIKAERNERKKMIKSHRKVGGKLSFNSFIAFKQVSWLFVVSFLFGKFEQNKRKKKRAWPENSYIHSSQL